MNQVRIILSFSSRPDDPKCRDGKCSMPIHPHSSEGLAKLFDDCDTVVAKYVYDVKVELTDNDRRGVDPLAVPAVKSFREGHCL